jgi:colanic acid/amylovoran biosynthesis glycosyltransferase
MTEQAAKTTPASNGAVRIAYLTTHYPSPSHTFIAGEIRGLEDLGIAVSPISVNAVPTHELLTDLDLTESARTFYVKSQRRAAIARRVLWFSVCRPGSVARALGLVRRMVGWDVHAMVWHVFHIVEAILVLHHCEAVGAGHIHSHFGGLPSTVALYASELSVHGGVRSVTWSVTVHGFHEFTNERSSLLQQKVRRAQFVVCVSDFTRSQLMRISEDPTTWANIHVVRCGIDIERFRFLPRPASDRFRIMTTARLVAEKGLSVLFDAAAILVARGVSIEVVVVGDGPARAGLAAYAASIGIGDRVLWTGFQPPSEVFRRLQEADVFCLPSFGEGLPIVLMEAMAVGVPVVATYLGGIPELVQNGLTGQVVPASRADLLADALALLAHNSPKRDALVKAARNQIEERHELHQSARQLLDIFRVSGVTDQ